MSMHGYRGPMDLEGRTSSPGHPFDDLPRVSRRSGLLEMAVRRWIDRRDWPDHLPWLAEALGSRLEFGPIEVQDRASGLSRSAAIAVLIHPGRAIRIGLGLETSLAHAVVDELLGHQRQPGEERYQVTPVEWGILSYVTLRSLDDRRRDDPLGPIGTWQLDRVSSQPFPAEDYGPLMTIRVAMRLGETNGALRIWIPVALAAEILGSDDRVGLRSNRSGRDSAFGLDLHGLIGDWRAESGAVRLPYGLRDLRASRTRVWAIEESTAPWPSNVSPGRLMLCLETSRWAWAIPVQWESGGDATARCVRVVDIPQRIPHVRETQPMDPTTSSERDPERDRDPEPSADPSNQISPPAQSTTARGPTRDLPLSLNVELGRINMSLERLADLQVGDLLELDRHPHEPVDLTCQGRLVARGDLVRLDNTMGIRIHTVYLETEREG